jgi:predicted ATPase
MIDSLVKERFGVAAIRHLRIENFRGIASLSWAPRAGINAIIGPGDSGKSTVLEAIDLVLGARRASFTDADFHVLDTRTPIVIEATIGDLPSELLNLDAYVLALRGWAAGSVVPVDEPVDGAEPVLTLRLSVGEDCEASWCLHSDRLAAAELPRDMRADHRARIAVQRLGTSVAQHLAWGPRSVLARLSDGAAGTGAVLARANRAARREFDVSAAADLQPAIDAAREVAMEMAVAPGLYAGAALDARAVNVGNGAVALHDSLGVPLRALGIGSSRLMAAGLQAKAASKVPILLLDEVEHGLEPHRIARLLQRLGAKAEAPTQQVFLTTHSPVALRELAAQQLWVARRGRVKALDMVDLARFDDAQSLLRSFPEAFLSPTVLVCEGATEIGITRGLDLVETTEGRAGLALFGVTLADGEGTRMWRRALGFVRLGFRTGLFRDSDRPPAPEEAEFLTLGGAVFEWDTDCAFEDQLFASIPLDLVPALFSIADRHHTSSAVDQHLRSAGVKTEGIDRLRTAPVDGDRASLARAAGTGKWFKRIDIAEEVGRSVLGPNLSRCGGRLGTELRALLDWFAAGEVVTVEDLEQIEPAEA